MSTTADERLVVMLEARIAEFEKRMKKAEGTGTRAYQGLRRGSQGATRQMEQDMVQSTGRINAALAATSTRIGVFGKAFVGGLIGGVATTAFAGLTSSIDATVKGIANLGNEAKRAGIGVEAFQEWKFVAEQNRIRIDALTDGFKELHIRAGEFFLDGTGAGAEAFKKLGYSAEELKRKLKDPSSLMVEILGRLKNLDQAGRSFLLEEIFGGAGGEQFSVLIGQGEAALRATIDRAHETGAVLDAELIAKAEELDRKFHELTTRVDTFGKQVAVSVADAGMDLLGLRAILDKLFPDEAQGRAVLGDDLYSALDVDPALAEQHAAALRQIRHEYDALAASARITANELDDAVANLEWDYPDMAGEVAAISKEMRQLAQDFDDNKVGAEDFTTRMGELERAASDAFAKLADGDEVEFHNVIAQLGRLGGVIGGIISLASTMGIALQRAAGVSPDQKATTALRQRHEAEAQSVANWKAMQDANDKFTASETARNAATTEALRLEREVEAVRKRAKDAGASITDTQARDMAAAALAGEAARAAADRAAREAGRGGGKGGKEKLDPFAREVQSIRDETLALEAEAAALIAVAKSGKTYGDAVEYARKRAELLNAAQRAGKEITPELKAEIDALAAAYVTAGQNAEEAAERLQRIEENGRRGAEAISDIFGSVLDGSKSAKEAIADLLMEMAKVQMQKAMLGIFGQGGPLSGVGSMVGGLLGGRAKGGPVQAGVPYLVNENTRHSEVFVPSTSGAVLNVPQAQAALRDGAVGASSMAVRVHVTAAFDESGNLYVRNVAQEVTRQGVAAGIQAYDRTLPGRLSQINSNPRRR